MTGIVSSGFSSYDGQRCLCLRDLFCMPVLSETLKILLQVERATIFLSNIRKKKRCWYFICVGHSHILTSHLTAGHAAWGREDANTSYLTSRRQSQPSPPSLFLPEVEQAAAADSAVVSSSHKATLSPSTTPSNTAPTAAAHTKTQLAWLIISVAGKFWQTRSWGGGCKVTVRDNPA